MSQTRPIVAFAVLVAMAALLLPAAVVCAAIPEAPACPMAALAQQMAEPAAPCHGASMAAEDGCCCAMREQAPVSLPIPLDVAGSTAPLLEAPEVTVTLPQPVAVATRYGERSSQRPHPKIDLFLHHSAFLI
jgi:hypothetical protein